MSTTDGQPPGGNAGGTGGNTSNGDTKAGPGFTVNRGRPVTIDPGNVGHNPATGDASADGSGSQPGQRKRGRPAGSTNRARAPETAGNLDTASIEQLLKSIHGMAAAFLKNAAWQLDDKEAHELAVASVNVSRHYDVQVAQKTVDWVNLASVVGMVYGSRVMLFRMQKQQADNAATPDAAQAHAAGGAPFIPVQR